MTGPYPLSLEPILVPKVWGGRRLAQFGKDLPPDVSIGESWEVADLGRTSVGGAGGGAMRSRIRTGRLAGATLSDAVAAWGEELLGAEPGEDDGRFPVLVKLLDARDSLSVQVHPPAEYAAAHEGIEAKSEVWVVLAAAPGARIYKGVRPGVSRDRLAAAARDGSVIDVVEAVPAVIGDCHDLPAGIVHALGAGVVVAEVQTPSDTTFRLYDWGRESRELHVDEGAACAQLGAAPPAIRVRPGLVAAAEAFWLWSPGPGRFVDAAPAPTWRVVMVTRGEARIIAAQGGFDPMLLATGDTVVLPAALVDQIVIDGAPGADVWYVGSGDLPG